MNVACVFPFTYKGIKHNKCIFEAGDETPWCSTKVDENGKHVSGQDQWGYCEETCPIDGKKYRCNIEILFNLLIYILIQVTL